MAGNLTVQSVTPMLLLFMTVRDLDCQCQQCFDQAVAKRQSSLLNGEQCKQAKTPPQADPHDAPISEHTQPGGHEDCERGGSKTRGKEHRQLELDRARSKSRACSRAHSRACSRAHSKSRKWSKSRKCSKSHKRSKSMRYGNQESGRPNGNGDRARGAVRKIGPAGCRVPVCTATSRPEVVGMLSIRHPLATNYQSSSS